MTESLPVSLPIETENKTTIIKTKKGRVILRNLPFDINERLLKNLLIPFKGVVEVL